MQTVITRSSLATLVYVTRTTHRPAKRSSEQAPSSAVYEQTPVVHTT